ncbi:hypothetical protein D3C87_2009420 [compost metagenome]
MMKTVPPLNDLFNMAGLNLPTYLKGTDEAGSPVDATVSRPDKAEKEDKKA